MDKIRVAFVCSCLYQTDRFCSRYCSGDKLGLNRGQSGTTSPSMWPSVLATTSEQQHLVEIFEVMSRSDVNATSDMDVIHGGTNTLWMRNSGLGLESQLRHSSSSFSVESRPPQDFGLSDRRMSRDLSMLPNLWMLQSAICTSLSFWIAFELLPCYEIHKPMWRGGAHIGAQWMFLAREISPRQAVTPLR